MTIPPIRLTLFSHGAGCGCKISPQILDTILHSETHYPSPPSLLVGNAYRDDAAVMDLGDGTAIISTTDFFMPIVDDPFDFGRVAAANAISDIYAMGGKPLLAIAILGWPIDKLSPEVAQRVIEGGRAACAEAGISLAGGHSIDNPEPIFGLAVTGRVKIAHIKQNTGAQLGDKLFLTKPLGIGILSTAQKRGILLPEHQFLARDWMVKLNTIGETLGGLDYVSTMTDVTGFGLLGHLGELCVGSGLSARLEFDKVPIIPEAILYLEQKAVPGGTTRNWDSYGHTISPLSAHQRNLLADPQTSGGLLILVNPLFEDEFQVKMKSMGLELVSFGQMISPQNTRIIVVDSAENP